MYTNTVYMYIHTYICIYVSSLSYLKKDLQYDQLQVHNEDLYQLLGCLVDITVAYFEFLNSSPVSWSVLAGGP